jgi:hypothetical protein
MALAQEFEEKAKAAEAEAVQTAVAKEAANEAAPEMPIAAMKPPEPEKSGDS